MKSRIKKEVKFKKGRKGTWYWLIWWWIGYHGLYQINWKIKLKWHKLVCRFWNWRIPKDLNYYLKEWWKIDHRKDKSWSGRDFRFYLYNHKVSK